MGFSFLVLGFVRSEISDVILDKLSRLCATDEDLVNGDMDCRNNVSTVPKHIVFQRQSLCH